VAFGRLQTGGFRIENYLAQWVLLLRFFILLQGVLMFFDTSL
jgi:hypothetical protein